MCRFASPFLDDREVGPEETLKLPQQLYLALLGQLFRASDAVRRKVTFDYVNNLVGNRLWHVLC